MAITFDRIVKLSTSKKVLILTALMAVILGLYFYLIYIPKSEVLTQKTAEMGKLETQVRELRIIAANVKRFQGRRPSSGKSCSSPSPSCPRAGRFPPSWPTSPTWERIRGWNSSSSVPPPR